MERGSITIWLLLGVAIFLILTQGRKVLFPTSAADRQPLVEDETALTEDRPAEGICTIEGDRFKAELSTYGASLRHLYLKDRKYTRPLPTAEGTFGALKQ